MGLAICTSAALIALAVLFLKVTAPARPAAADTETDTARAAAAERAARADDRGATAVDPAPSAAPSVEPSSPAPAAPATSAPAPLPTRKLPVAGLSLAQMDNAVAVVDAGRSLGVPERAHVVAMVTALQESNLLTLANPAVPASLNFPSQGMGYDHDSVGIFQQRASTGWGPVAQLMSPAGSALTFYSRLMKVPGWQYMSVGAAAQAVQRSAFPYAYDKHEVRARQIVGASL